MFDFNAILQSPWLITGLSFAAWTIFWHTIMGLGITIGYHRLLTHNGFKTHNLVEKFFVTLGFLALQGHPAHWVAVHRIHHAHSDKALDPHSPVEKGWWYGQIGWIGDTRYEEETQYQTFPVLDIVKKSRNTPPEYCHRWAKELVDDPYYRILERTDVFVAMQIVSFVLAYLMGGPVGLLGRLVGGATTFWSTGWVNSYCHMPWLGGTPYKNKTKDSSTNIWWVAMVSAGEGWHNNHHAFQKSARHGLEWWQFDLSWAIISSMKAVGLVWDVYVPSKDHLKRSVLPLNVAAEEAPMAVAGGV